MENVILNQQCVQMVIDWDPLGYGPESYDTEAADVVAALQGTTDVAKLAKTIQQIFEFSYEETIPYEACATMAQQLITNKLAASCDL